MSPSETAALMIAVLELGGFGTAEVRRPDVTDMLSTEADQLYLDRSVPTDENLKMLKLQILTDLAAERKELFRLQCAAGWQDYSGSARQTRCQPPVSE